MKKGIVLIAVIFAAIFSVSAYATDMKAPVGEVYVPFTDSKPVFDGVLNDDAWENALKIHIDGKNAKAVVSGGFYDIPETSFLDMYLIWDESYLYWAYDVTDPTHCHWTEDAFDGGDAIQLFIDGGNMLRGITCLDIDSIGSNRAPLFASAPQVTPEGNDASHPLWLHQCVVNESVITDYEIYPASAKVTEYGWTFEGCMTWDLIAEDIMAKCGNEMGEVKSGFEFSMLVIYLDYTNHSTLSNAFGTTRTGYEDAFSWEPDEFGINCILLGAGETAPSVTTYEPDTSSPDTDKPETTNTELTSDVPRTADSTSETTNRIESDTDNSAGSSFGNNTAAAVVLLALCVVLSSVAAFLLIKKKNKKIAVICFVLSAAFLTGSIVCFVKKTKQQNDKPNITDDISGKYNDGTKYRANVPDIEYNGATFTIMCRDPEMGWGEMAIVSTTQEEALTVLDNATYNRNQRISEDYDVKLNFVTFNDANASADSFYVALNENGLSGDNICDICIPGIIDAAVLSSGGLFVNLDNVPYVDLDAPWWQKSLNDSMRLLNRQYFAINDSLLNDKQDTYVMFFNKSMFDDVKMEYPYSLVDSGQWTIDRFSEMIKNYGSDLNSNNVADYEDKYGFVGFIYDVFYVGSGYTAAYLDKDTGLPVLRDMDSKMQNIYEKVYKIVKGGSSWDTYSVGQEPLYNNDINGTFGIAFDEKSLFTCGPLGFYFSLINKLVSDVGMVPCPKYDETQTRYYHRAGYNGSTAITILKTTSDQERAGIILEAFGAESKNFISPAYYEKLLTNRYAQDEDSKRMITLVIDTEVFDLDQIFRWGAMLESLQSVIGVGNPGSAAGVYARNLTAARARLDETIEQYLKLQNN